LRFLRDSDIEWLYAGSRRRNFYRQVLPNSHFPVQLPIAASQQTVIPIGIKASYSLYEDAMNIFLGSIMTFGFQFRPSCPLALNFCIALTGLFPSRN